MATRPRGKSVSRNWRDARAEAAAAARNEEDITEGSSQLEGQIRTHLLAEVRKERNVTQVEIARRLGVGQPRISQLERGDPNRVELSTLRAYIEALGGHLEVSATFGERRLRIA
jgi:predicted XRE-type DNA-binding protein